VDCHAKNLKVYKEKTAQVEQDLRQIGDALRK